MIPTSEDGISSLPSAVTVTNLRVIHVDKEGLPDSGPTDVTCRAGRIVEIGDKRRDAARVFDGDGRYALPGLVNAHEHLYSKELRSPDPGMDIRSARRDIDQRDASTTLAVMLRNAWRAMLEGILVVRDLGARHGLNTDLARIFDAGVIPGPCVVAAGRPIVMTGGHVWTFGREADGSDECRRAVREQRKAGARVIKVMASGGVSNYPHEDFNASEFTEAELAAITSEAKKLGLLTCAHAYGEAAVRAAVDAGINSIEHGVDIVDETIEKMARDEISYVPTMANMSRIASAEMNIAAGVPERAALFTSEIVEPQRRSVASALRAGVRIGIGADSIGSYLEEINELTEVGMSEEQVIRAATVEGARICGVEAGVIAPGHLALMALYEDDPRHAVERLVTPSAVFVTGTLFERAELRKLVSQ